MTKTINIKSDNALKELTQLKEKRYVMYDVKLQNVHLIRINLLIGTELFFKNDLFVNSDTLWSLMQEEGENTSHNHHGLTPVDILDALNNIQNPYCIFKTKQQRVSIVVSCLSHYGEPLMAIIEIGADLIGEKDSNINKLVTMYPQSDVDRIIDKLKPNELLYLNKIIQK